MKYPNRIREARQRVGVGADELAAVLGVCRDTVYRWERGEVNFPAGALLKIGYFFGVSCDWLSCLSDDPHKTVDGRAIDGVESGLDRYV